MTNVIQNDLRKKLSDLLLVRIYELRTTLKGTTLELLPLTEKSNILLGVGIIKNSRMYLYLSKNGKTTFTEFINWIIQNNDRFSKPYYFFKSDFDLLSHSKEFFIFHTKFKEDISLIEEFRSNEEIWGHISSKLHKQKLFYSPQWAYQFSQQSIFGEQILQFIELILLNKLTLIINKTANYRIIDNISATTCLEGESAVGVKKGSILDIETTGIDAKKSNIVSVGFLSENRYIILFNHANLNTNSFNLITKEMINENVSQPIFVYNIDFEKSFLRETHFEDLKPVPKDFHSRKKEVYLPNDDDPGSGANIPMWFKLFLSGGDIKKRKLYRRLILLHNRACLINQLAILSTNYKRTTVKTEWDQFHFPYQLVSDYRHKVNSETKNKLIFLPDRYWNKYSYKDGFYSRYFDESYLFKLGLKPAPDHYQSLVSSNGALIRLYQHFDAQLPEMIPYDSLDMDRRLRNQLEIHGINSLYEYQYYAFTQINNGVSTLITAPTGNGKTEAFLLPVFQRILTVKDIESREVNNENKSTIKAIIFYPTKALSNDQFNKITKWTRRLGISVKQLDGDIGKADRKIIQSSPPDILLTTPDWLHYNLYKQEWQNLLKNVELVIFDEVHTYSGNFGTHIFLLLQRLQRVIGKIQVIGASATIGNPKEYFRRLTGENISVIYCKDTLARKPELDLLLISPNNDKKENYNISNLILDLTSKQYEHSVLVFRNSQQQAEYTFQELQNYLGNRVEIHRGGLDKGHRQQVENNLRTGQVKVVVCTSSLELGIDIGNISAIISPLVPINNLYQRIGRAGRRGKPALAILELSNDIISEFYIRHPKEYFSDVAPVIFDVNNRRVIYDHLQLAEHEKVIEENEFQEYEDILELMARRKESGENINQIPMFSIRNNGISMKIIYKNRCIATRSFPFAFWEYFPYAMRFIGGTRFVVTQVEKTQRFNKPHYVAMVERVTEGGFMIIKPLKSESYHFLGEPEEITNKLPNIHLILGKGKVILNIKGVERRFGRSTQREKIFFSQYSYIHRTNVLEIEFLNNLKVEIIHTLKHLLRGAIQMKLGLKTEYFFLDLKTKIVIYDASEGGNGSIISVFKRIKYLFERMFQTLDSCTCTMIQGCPKCTFDINCRNPGIELNKNETRKVLEDIL